MNGYDFGAPMTQTQRAAYNDGMRSGELDRQIGRRSTLASTSFDTEPDYTRYYSAGYRKANP